MRQFTAYALAIAAGSFTWVIGVLPGGFVNRITFGTDPRLGPIETTTQQEVDPTLSTGVVVLARSGVGIVHIGTVAAPVTQSFAPRAPAKINATMSAPAQRTAPVPPVRASVTRKPAAPPTSSTKPPGPGTLKWDAVAQCESGGNWSDNTGNGYYGGLQFGTPTWISNGGAMYAPRADLATKAQQIDIANRLYAARGAAPWPACGRFL